MTKRHDLVRLNGQHDGPLLSVLEFDMGADSSETLRQCAVEPAGVDARPVMASLASEMAQFGRQAPALRAVLVTSPLPLRHVAHEHPEAAGLEWHGAVVYSAAAAESILIDAAVREGLIRIEGGRPVLAESADDVTSAVFTRVVGRRNVVATPGGRNDFRNAERQALTTVVALHVPFDVRSGYLSQRASRNRETMWNGGYYVWLEEEFADPFCAAGDPVGLYATGGEIISPPVYRRTALLVVKSHHRADDQEQVLLRSVSLSEMEVGLPNGEVIVGSDVDLHGGGSRVAKINPANRHASDVAFYNRLWNTSRSGGQTAAHTPRANEDSCIEFAISGQAIVAGHRGGETPIPLNGFVVSLPRDWGTEELFASLNKGGVHTVNYRLLLPGLDVVAACQVGPTLITEGVPRDVARDLQSRREEYVPRDDAQDEEGLIPIALTPVRQTDERRARIAVGLGKENKVFVVAAEGCEPRSFLAGEDQLGVTLDELLQELLRMGCTDAAALDGGGAAALFVDGHATIRPADRNDVAGVPAERIVPSAWLLGG